MSEELGHVQGTAPETPTFDYSCLPNNLCTVIRANTTEFSRHMNRSVQEYGEACINVMNVNAALAERYTGRWAQWCTSVGLSVRSATRMVEVGKSILGSAKLAELVQDGQIGKSLLQAICAPSADAAAVEQVLSGDITTYKEYQDLLKENQQLRTDRVNAMNQAEREKARADTAESQLDAVRADVAGLTQRVDAAEAREEEAWQMQSKAEQRAKNAEEALKKQPITGVVDKDEVQRQADALAAKAKAQASKQVEDAQRRASEAEAKYQKLQQAADGFLAPEQACAQQAQIIADSMRSMYLGWFGPASSTGVPLARMAAPIYQVCDEIQESLEDDTTIHPTAAGSEEDAEREALFV